jgi:hypothetical protein
MTTAPRAAEKARSMPKARRMDHALREVVPGGIHLKEAARACGG